MKINSLQADLYTMFKEHQALEFSEWVSRVELHVSTLKIKLCTFCNSNKLEVVNMYKAKCNNCQTLNNF